MLLDKKEFGKKATWNLQGYKFFKVAAIPRGNFTISIIWVGPFEWLKLKGAAAQAHVDAFGLDLAGMLADSEFQVVRNQTIVEQGIYQKSRRDFSRRLDTAYSRLLRRSNQGLRQSSPESCQRTMSADLRRLNGGETAEWGFRQSV